MMPLSFFAMLGGTCTLIGTSTNIIVSSYARDQGMGPIGMFELSPVGVVLFAVCGVFIVVASRWLLPERVAAESFTEDYHLRPFLSEVLIPEGSVLAGASLAEARLAERYDLEVLDIFRGDRRLDLPGPEVRLREHDVLIVKASARALARLRDDTGLAMRHGRHPDDAELGAADSVLVEVLVPANSRLEGRTLKQVDFRRRYGAVVLAVRHHGADLVEKVAHVRLALGDEMLVLARTDSLERLRRQRDLVVLQELDLQLLRTPHVMTSLAIVGGVVVTAAAGLLSIAEAAVVGSVLMVVTRCLPLRRVYESIDWRVIVLLAGLIPLGTALESSGAAQKIVGGMIRLVGDQGPTAALGALFFLTLLLTGFMSNNAAAALLAPLAVVAAGSLGVESRPFLMAVTFAASGAFYTPIGYQTNLLVYGPGGYRFIDYLRFGGPLALLYGGLATLLIPVFFPF
jgi:di/tricarboxylate transporter